MTQPSLTKQVWKYRITAPVQETEMPGAAHILAVQMQDNVPTIWAEVWPEEKLVTRKFHVFGTGQPFEARASLKYLGTCQSQGGLLVWHVYEDIQ